MLLVELDILIAHHFLQVVRLELHDDEEGFERVLVACGNDIDDLVGEHIVFHLGQLNQDGQLPYDVS